MILLSTTIQKNKMMTSPQISACLLAALMLLLVVVQLLSTSVSVVVSSFSISSSSSSTTLMARRMASTTTTLFVGNTGSTSKKPSKKKTKKKKKNKPSMAERMKRRQNKAKGVNTGDDDGQHVSPFAGLPTTVLESQQQPKKKEGGGDDNSTTTTSTTSSDGPIHVENPKAAANKAKELLRAQRQSVNMLTFVKEQIDEHLTTVASSSSSDLLLMKSLETNGYAVIDDFLANKNNKNKNNSENDSENEKSVDGTIILPELENEVHQLMTTATTKPTSSSSGNENENDDELSTPIIAGVPMMEIDPLNIGSGEYITSIQGGEQQYTVCPRIVEFVVSSTKNIPEAFISGCDEEDGDDSDSDNNQETTSSFSLSLDPSACMATLRCFDRKALMASLSLLTGTDDDSVLDDTYQKTPFDVIAKDGVDDKRRLSLYYFIVPDTWNAHDDDDDSNDNTTSTTRDGGGLTFESTGEMVFAKRDRLVLVLSDKTKCKKIPWKGNSSTSSSSSNTLASAIELHLIQKRE